MTRDEKIQDIKQHPEKHRHTFEALQACCTLDNAVDLLVMDAHQEYVSLGTNGGTRKL
jgi:hypothetical protein